GMINDPEPLYRLATTRIASISTRDEAIELLTRAVATKPDYERVDALVGEILEHDPEWDPGIDLLEQVARGLGRSDLLARALSRRLRSSKANAQQFEEAVALARKASDGNTLEQLLNAAVDGKIAERIPHAMRAEAELELADILAARGEIDRALYLRENASEFVGAEQKRRLLLDIAKIASERLQDNRRASVIYERLLEATPSDPGIYKPLLELLRQLDDKDRLFAALNRTLDSVQPSPERVELQLELSQLALSRGDTGAAADQLRDLLREDPSHSEAARLLAGILERSGRHAELIILLSKQFELAQTSLDGDAVRDLGMRIAELCEQQARFAEGLAALAVVLEWCPGHAIALRSTVRLAEAVGDISHAATALELLMLQPGEPDVAQLIERLIWLRERLGDEAGVERAMLRAFEANPTDPGLCDALVGRFKARGDLLSLASVLDRAARARPDDLALALRLVEAYRTSGQLDDALAVIEGLFAFGADSPLLHRERGRILSRLERHEDALTELELGDPSDVDGAHALLDGIHQASPSAPEAWQPQLGLREVSLLEQLGDLDLARQVLAQLEVHFPSHLAVLGAKARLAATSGDLAGAVDAYVGLAEVLEGDELIPLVIELSHACHQLGTPERARAALERAISFEPNHGELRAHLVEIYRAIGARRELAGLMLFDARQVEDVVERQSRLLEAAELLSGDDGDPALAEAILEEARQVGPENLDVVLLLARARAQSGRVDDAVAMLNDVVAAQRGRRSKAVARIYQELSQIQLNEGML
ncbi:MAG TPA: tetratricopeptide repeat protein, partial [Polyangiaceae bacterium]